MKIVFFGDSITDAGRSREVDYQPCSYGTGYVHAIASELLAENPVKYKIVNRGISGHRVVDLYARIKADMWNEEPDVLSVLIGINDIWHEIGGKNGVEIDRFDRVYRMMIEDTLQRFPNLKIVICEPFVLEGVATSEYMGEYFSQVIEYAAAAKKIAKDYGLYFLPLQDKLTKAAATYGAEHYLSDGVHPAMAGAKLIADEWLALFKNEIDK